MELIVDTRLYGDDGIPTFFGQILNRLQVQPENGLFFLIFLLAIIHSFFAPSIHAYARRKREFSTSGFKVYSLLSVPSGNIPNNIPSDDRKTFIVKV